MKINNNKVFNFVKASDSDIIDWSNPDYTGASAKRYVEKYTNRPEDAGTLEGLQDVLAGIGVVADPADWVNAAIYAVQGEYGNAALYASGLGMLGAIKTVKGVGKAIKAKKATQAFKYDPSLEISDQVANMTDSQIKAILTKNFDEDLTTAYATISHIEAAALKNVPTEYEKVYMKLQPNLFKTKDSKLIHETMENLRKRKDEIMESLNRGPNFDNYTAEDLKKMKEIYLNEQRDNAIKSLKWEVDHDNIWGTALKPSKAYLDPPIKSDWILNAIKDQNPFARSPNPAAGANTVGSPLLKDLKDYEVREILALLKKIKGE